jgi:2-succinyl-5-enolpyruvyl-6-hydroxy-3-cyclohexene-1-carboxylate synthase
MEAAAHAGRAGARRVSASSSAEALDGVVGAFVDELARAGVRHACACPGSRSTPLSIKLGRHPNITQWMHLDERSAAYFGLGLARALREPVALLSTSGTAAANFFPALIEAFYARVPLIVLTADRPHELRDCGAPQTIDQLRLYGEHVKWFFDLPEPEPALSSEHVRLVRTVAARAVDSALADPLGPVHLNWPLREPLVPEAHASPTGAWGARSGGRPYVDVRREALSPSANLIATLSDELADTRRGVIVCGPQDDPDVPQAAVRLADRLGYPILADPLSSMRRGSHERSLVIDTYDAFLRDAMTVERLEPEVVLRFGAIPTSKPALQYLQRYASARQILVDRAGWREPTGLASDVLRVDPRLLCEALAASLPDRAAGEWAATWQTINAATREAIASCFAHLDELFEGKVFSELASLLPAGALLYAGNSMPVRDLETFWPASSRAVRCLSNRGANGIDGVVSSALGASAARVGPVVLVIGDISFYHDMNGLLAARKHGLDLVVVLLNNDGGGIFSFLPQTDLASREFEILFGTPHGLDFRPFVEGYAGRFVRVADWPEFASAVTEGLSAGGLQVVEVPTERTRNVALHREVWRIVADALARPVAASVR